TTAALGSGFSATPPVASQMRESDMAPRTLPIDSAALFFWVDAVGIRSGDVSTIMLLAPDGTVLASHEEPSDRPRASIFRFIGVKVPEKGWAPGDYKGVYILRRGEEQILVVREHVVVK